MVRSNNSNNNIPNEINGKAREGKKVKFGGSVTYMHDVLYL